MLLLTQINIYPVKSLDGFSPSTAIVEERGLQHDRRWMIVDTLGLFLSQRTVRKMTQLRATIIDQNLCIAEKNNPENQVLIPIAAEGKPMLTRVWDDTVTACLTSTLADDFLSQFLGVPCHLVKMPLSSERLVDEKYRLANDTVSFADGFPFLIIGEASMQDLNKRLAQPLNPEGQSLEGLRRFRTNFIFSGGKPYEEESWKDFNIGNVGFSGRKPCGRCVMITLDPDNGTRGNEPLRTLAEYRSVGNKVLFGQNLLWNSALWQNSEVPVVSVGDVITS